MTSLFINQIREILDNLNELCENEIPINLKSLCNTIGTKIPNYGFTRYGEMRILTNFGIGEKEYAIDVRLLKKEKYALFIGEEAWRTEEGTVVIQRIERLNVGSLYLRSNREIELLSYINSLLLDDENLDVDDFYFAFANKIYCVFEEDYDSNGLFYVRYLDVDKRSIAEIQVRGQYPNEVVEGSDEIRYIQKIIFRGKNLYERIF